jgi:hypothetical protein
MGGRSLFARRTIASELSLVVVYVLLRQSMSALARLSVPTQLAGPLNSALAIHWERFTCSSVGSDLVRESDTGFVSSRELRIIAA